jgi:ABC-type glutathione transport system ATPase component
MTVGGPLLQVSITADYAGRAAVLSALTFSMRPGEILGLVGRSGAGKSTLALAILGLLRHRGGAVRGRIRFEDQDLLDLPEKEMRRIRGRRISLVPQSPLSALNPHLRIGAQLLESWKAHESGPAEVGRARIREVIGSVCLPQEESFQRRFPSELSVGQAQRVLIAMALLHRPALLIADEPTSALDALTRAEILQLFAALNRQLGTAILFISHDFLSVAALCRRVAVLHDGCIVESGTTGELLGRPSHPYTQALVGAVSAPWPEARYALA